MSSFKDGLRRSGQSVLDARAQNLYEMTKIEEERDLRVANIEYALALKVDGEEFPADETEEQINVAAVLEEDAKLN